MDNRKTDTENFQYPFFSKELRRCNLRTSLISLFICHQIKCKDGNKEKELNTDTFPVETHGKGFVGEAADTVCDLNVPVSRQKAGNYQNLLAQHILGNKDTAEKTHA